MGSQRRVTGTEAGGSIPYESVLGELRAAIARQRLNQVSAANLTGISQTSLSRRLSGQAELTVAELIHICDSLGLSIVDLLADAQKHGGPVPRPRSTPGVVGVSAVKLPHLDSNQEPTDSLAQVIPFPRAHRGQEASGELLPVAL